jgi:hypothetical protein
MSDTEIVRAYNDGQSSRQIARAIGMEKTFVLRVLRAYRSVLWDAARHHSSTGPRIRIGKEGAMSTTTGTRTSGPKTDTCVNIVL